MKKEKTFKVLKIKYFIAFFALFILAFLLILKQEVNNVVTKIYFIASVIGVIGITVLVLYCILFKNSKKVFNITFEITDFFALFISACCIFQAFFVFGYFKADVDGLSMYPTLNHEDVLIVRSTRKVTNFEVVVVSYNDEYNSGHYVNGKLLVKRLIGKEGDTLYFEDGKLYLNNTLVEEKYINSMIYDKTFDLSGFSGKGVTLNILTGEYIIDKDYYFVMGDNRDNSLDSRDFGLFHKSQVVGKAVYRVFGIAQWQKFDGIDFE